MRSSCSRIAGTAAAASGLLTVMRTISEPARASSLTWMAVPITSAVSVLVIDCTTTGASPPTHTWRWPYATSTLEDARRASGPEAMAFTLEVILFNRQARSGQPWRRLEFERAAAQGGIDRF